MLLPLTDYDRTIISCSGGKDSVACVLQMLDLGARNIVLYHQCVDGEPGTDGLMDWPCTEGYVRSLGQHLGLPVQFQWKRKGFEGEMLRENALTQPVFFQQEDGTVGQAGGKRGKNTTRRKFPQVSADLSVRWCSAYLKIDVAAMAINNDPALKNKKILFITGERREESTARSKYQEVELHRCNSKKRLVHHWRPVIDWQEQQVWDKIKEHKIRPHWAYCLGFSRVSCMTCIFGNSDQWATIRKIAPDTFQKIASYESEFNCTIKKSLTVINQADKGSVFPAALDEYLLRLALSKDYPSGHIFIPDGQEWLLPAGAFKMQGGPC